MQLYSAAVERVNLINNGGSALPPLSLTASYICDAGTNQSIDTIGGTTYTNWILAYTNITLTNCFTNFTYTYSDYSGEHTASGMPYITRSQLAALDAAILSLIPYFVCTNAGVIGLPLSSYLTNKFWNIETDVIPMESRAGLFARESIGLGNGYITNSYGWTNGGSAYFTRGKESEFGKVLAGVSYSTNGLFTNGWQLSFFDAYPAYLFPPEIGAYAGKRGYYITDGSNPTWYDENRLTFQGSGLFNLYKPLLQYQPAGSNTFTNIAYEIWGELITNPWQIASTPYVETGVMDSTNFTLTNTWVYITNIVIHGSSPNTNDSYVIKYTNSPLMLYGERPYNITTADLDERWKVLTKLICTKYSNGYGGGLNHPQVSHAYVGREYQGKESFSYYTNWNSCWVDVSNALAASTNWVTLTNDTTRYMFDFIVWYVDDGEYFIDMVAGVRHLSDAYPQLNNVYSSIPKTYSLFWGDRGVVGGVSYYNFSQEPGIAPREDVFYQTYTCLIPDTNACLGTLPVYYRNPINGIESPTNSMWSYESRKQTQSDWFLIMDWSAGLKYK
jgi:hypothetical protein